MTTKYSASLFRQNERGYIGEYNWYNRDWHDYWFCRELAVNAMRTKLNTVSAITRPTVLALTGVNMRGRTKEEQVGMLRFANIMFPDNFTFVDCDSIYVESEQIAEDRFVYPMPQVMSVAYFFIKYLTIQMKDRVSVDRLCKTFVKRKHQCFHGIPDQQLGTAFYTWAYIHYKEELVKHRQLLEIGNGPGTAMRRLANEDEETIGGQSEASKLYSFLLSEWVSQYKAEITDKMNEHCRNYERIYYMPLLMQDLYKRIYDGDGYFDDKEYGENEW